MKIKLIHTGKTRFHYIKEVCSDYYHRICRYVPFNELNTNEIKNPGNMPVDILKKREGEQILKMVNDDDILVLFDERGRQFTSRAFAAWLEKQFMEGRTLVFVTGGAFGFPEELYKRAEEKISLSKMTFSHQMVRILVAEQLYRALTIIKGEKYHH